MVFSVHDYLSEHPAPKEKVAMKIALSKDHNIRIVYLVINRTNNEAFGAFLTRKEARERHTGEERVVRCEVLETKRTEGGA